MPKLTEELWKTLEKIRDDEFKKFKWFLKQDDILEGFSGIPEARLEKADRQDTVDLIVQKYQGPGALKVTLMVLEKIDRNDLVQLLQSSSSGPKDLKTYYNGAQREESNREKLNLKWAKQFAVEVTLDPDTAHPRLILSHDGKQVHHGDVIQNLPYNPKRFTRFAEVLGKQSFSTGRFYFEVQVDGTADWTVGVASKSTDREGDVALSPENGFWTISLRRGNGYIGNDNPFKLLSLKSPIKKVGVFVVYEGGLVSFYDVDAADLLFSFTGCSFTEKLYPFFCPENIAGGAPLIICDYLYLQVFRFF